MIRITSKLLATLALLGVSQMGSAQVLSYVLCEVDNGPAFVAAVNRFHNAMEGGVRPTTTVIDQLWNGPNDVTHTLLFDFPDYESLEAWQARVGETPAALLVIELASGNAQCEDEGLALERGFWGDRDGETPMPFSAVFPVSTSDPAAYMEAYGELATAMMEDSPGPSILFEVRAGGEGLTHFVVLLAPTLTALNEWIDSLPQSDDYVDFIDEVSSYRTLGTLSQGRAVRTWQP